MRAAVSDDLRSVSGTIELPDGMGLVDPLARLPDPPDDLHRLRTWPGRPDRGEVRWDEIAPGRYAFTARLPHRYGDIGWTAKGLMANGAWYPQPTAPDDALPIVAWEVQVTLPEGRVGALGTDAGQGVLSWSGVADRAALAVVRRGRLTQLGGDHWSVDLVTRGRARPILVRELARTLDATATEDIPLRGAAVEGPLRRRLVRPGPGLVYLSDRTFRLTPPLQRIHRVAVARGTAAAFVPQPDPFLREVAGAAVAASRAEALGALDAEALLGPFRWVPSIHWLLIGQRMPFYADVLDRPHPSDRLRDDLAEVLRPAFPGTAVFVQAEDRFGGDAATALGIALAAGATPRQAELAVAIPAGWLDRWRVPYPLREDYVLSVDPEERAVTVRREVQGPAPPETVVVRANGQRLTHTFDGAITDRTWTLDRRPRKVVLDPDGHLLQTSRLGDAWPERYMVTANAGISSINLTRGRVFGSATVGIRRAWDTHNLYRATLFNTFSDLVGAKLSWYHQEGRPRGTGWTRPNQFTVWALGSLLNPGFADLDGLEPTVGAGVSYGWDTRILGDFPMRGRRLGADVSAGMVPGLGESWLHAGPSATAVLSPHPRYALALLAEAAAARASVPHRKLALGGYGFMRSLPALPACTTPASEGGTAPCQTLADLRAMGAVEARAVPIRHASVPMGLAWGNELQITGGLEAMVARIEGSAEAAVGLTAGLSGVADILGAEPYLGGLTVGWPVAWTRGITGVERGGWPEIYLRWSQAF